MRERALMGAMFGVGVVTAFVAGLELGLVEVRPSDPGRVPAMSAANEAAKPAPAWSPPSAALAPAEAAAHAEPRPEVMPGVEPTHEAERRDAAAEVPAQIDHPATRVPHEASRMAGVQPPPAPRAQVPTATAAPSRESQAGDAPSQALSARPPSMANASLHADASTDRLVEQRGTAVPEVHARPDVRSLPLVHVQAAPGPRELLAPDAATVQAPAASGPRGEALAGSATASAPTAPDPLVAVRSLPAPQAAADTPAATETAHLELMSTSQRPRVAASSADTVRARATSVGAHPVAPLRELSQTRTAGVVGPPLARSTVAPPAAAPSPVNVPIAWAPPSAPAPSAPTPTPSAPASSQPAAASPVAAPPSAASPAQPSRVTTAPVSAVNPPDPAPRKRKAATTPAAPANEPSTHAPDRPRKSATPSRKRSRADVFRSRASLGQRTRAVPRAGVTVRYGARPAYRGSGPVLIRIHRARNGRVRTTRMPAYW